MMNVLLAEFSMKQNSNCPNLWIADKIYAEKSIMNV